MLRLLTSRQLHGLKSMTPERTLQEDAEQVCAYFRQPLISLHDLGTTESARGTLLPRHKSMRSRVYRHFPRKHDLYVAVLESELQQVYFRGDLLARIAEASDGRTVLERTFELLAKTLMHKPEILRLLQYSALELNENFDPLVRRYLGELVEVLARYLEPWVKRGELAVRQCEDRNTHADRNCDQPQFTAACVPG